MYCVLSAYPSELLKGLSVSASGLLSKRRGGLFLLAVALVVGVGIQTTTSPTGRMANQAHDRGYAHRLVDELLVRHPFPLMTAPNLAMDPDLPDKCRMCKRGRCFERRAGNLGTAPPKHDWHGHAARAMQDVGGGTSVSRSFAAYLSDGRLNRPASPLRLSTRVNYRVALVYSTGTRSPKKTRFEMRLLGQRLPVTRIRNPIVIGRADTQFNRVAASSASAAPKLRLYL